MEIRTEVERTSLAHLLYRVRDFTPECFEYVPGSAEWQATNGDVANEESKPNEFTVTDEFVEFTHGPGVTATPFWMTAEYKVTCEVGAVNTGGTWIKRAPASNDELGKEEMGPTVTVTEPVFGSLGSITGSLGDFGN